MKFVMDEKVFFEFVHGPTGAVASDLRRRGRYVTTAAKRQVGSKTGALRRSIDYELRANAGGLYVRIGSPLPYALMHHEGTAPHLIFPRFHRALQFNVRGKRVTTVVVHHPGTHKNPYLTAHLPAAVTI